MHPLPTSWGGGIGKSRGGGIKMRRLRPATEFIYGVALVHRDPPPPAPVKLTKINCISMKTLRFLQAWQRELYK
ncbi:MAG: hypothetical protein ABSG78_24045, partial [Verrucomicrobiota bacterium]